MALLVLVLFMLFGSTAYAAGQPLVIGGYPAQLFMLSIAGETSGNPWISMGDNGKAYGICQMDYRYSLSGFMQYAYQKHPELWPAFEAYQETEAGSSILVSNEEIQQAFEDAMKADYNRAIEDQLVYMADHYWQGLFTKLEKAGLEISKRNVAVAAALFSVSVNCGSHSDLFLAELKPEMTDVEMILKIYELRNTVLAEQKHETIVPARFQGAELCMALDLLCGKIGIGSRVNYGSGVVWNGNIFIR